LHGGHPFGGALLQYVAKERQYVYNEIDNKEVILATTVYDILDLELQDGTEVKVRPLDLKRLRKVMKVINDMNDAALVAADPKAEAKDGEEDDEYDNLEFLIRATKICLEKQVPDLVKDDERFEEALDLPTIWKILETAAGISMGNPNLQREAALPGLI
jgi:hypothetical protein